MVLALYHRIIYPRSGYPVYSAIQNSQIATGTHGNQVLIVLL